MARSRKIPIAKITWFLLDQQMEIEMALDFVVTCLLLGQYDYFISTIFQRHFSNNSFFISLTKIDHSGGIGRDHDAVDGDDDDDDDEGKAVSKLYPVMNKGFCHLMTGLMHHNGPRRLLASLRKSDLISNHSFQLIQD